MYAQQSTAPTTPAVAPASSTTPSPPASTLSQANAEVMKAQRFLAELGYNPGPADGLYGRKTRGAIEEYQSSEGLVVDGAVSASLLIALQSDAQNASVSILRAPKRDFCGQAGDDFKQELASFDAADGALGPFTVACKAHDECYVSASKTIVASIEARYQMTVSDGEGLDQYKTEANRHFEARKLTCDGNFLADIKQACSNNDSMKKLVLSLGSTIAPTCDEKAAIYYAGVTSRWGDNAFDSALATALQTPRPVDSK
jgi:hypothetical protein